MVVVQEAELIVFSEDGLQLFRCVYDAKGGIVRFRQINDLVIITNSHRLPMMLTNRGGVYDLEDVVWDHYPLEGSFNQSFPLSFSGVNFRVGDAWDFCERQENGDEGTDPGKEVVEVDRKIYSFDFRQYVASSQQYAGVIGGYQCWIYANYEGAAGWYHWQLGRSVHMMTGDYYNCFPSVTVAGGKTYRFDFPGNWKGEIIVEKSINNGSSWQEKIRLNGIVKSVEETVERDTLVRFKFSRYVSQTNWVEQPVIEVFRRMVVIPSGEGDVRRAEYHAVPFFVAVSQNELEFFGGEWSAGDFRGDGAGEG